MESHAAPVHVLVGTADGQSANLSNGLLCHEGLAEVAKAPAGRSTFLTDKAPHALLIDALPYVDPIPADLQQEVQQLLQQEMAAIAKENSELPDYLKGFSVPKTPRLDDVDSLIGKELRRKAAGEQMPSLDMSPYSAFSRPTGAKAADPREWEKAVNLCEQLLQHAAVTHVNLELMNAHATISWPRHLDNLSQANQRGSAAVKRYADEADSICKARKLEQVEAASILKQLESTCAQFKEKNAKIFEALAPLSAEVALLKDRCRLRGTLPQYAEADELDIEAWEEAVGGVSP